MRFLFAICLFCASASSAATIDQLKTLAQQNDAEAQYQLGLHYQLGDGVERDMQTAFYWFQTAAEQGQHDAKWSLVEAYSQGQGTEKNTTQVAYWLLNLSANNDGNASLRLAKLFDADRVSLSNSQWQTLFLRLAASQSPEGETAYNAFLEQQFNQKRKAQVGQLSQFDDVENQDSKTAQQPNLAEPTLGADYLSTGIAILIGVAFLTLFARSIKKRQAVKLLKQELNSVNARYERSKSQVVKQNQQLNTLIKQSKRRQQLDKEEQAFVVSCSILGYTPDTLPDAATLKARYRHLSRVYHPDASGSNEEMKRLNTALKIVVNRLRNAK